MAVARNFGLVKHTQDSSSRLRFEASQSQIRGRQPHQQMRDDSSHPNEERKANRARKGDDRRRGGKDSSSYHTVENQEDSTGKSKLATLRARDICFDF